MKAFIFLPIIILLGLFTPQAVASSQQAYQDYLFQFDTYRQKYSEFSVAKNEYQKFGTLTSQTSALEKTKAMLSQRDLLLRAYLLLLNEKLNEDKGLSATERQTYQSLIHNEVVFLEGHSTLVESIGSINDAVDTSDELVSHYRVLQASIRQTIGGISLGSLALLARQFDTALASAQAIVNENRGTFSPQKQANIDRWLLQITNVRSLYQQKVEQIIAKNNAFKSNSLDLQSRNSSEIKQHIGEARAYLLEGSANLTELIGSLRYTN